MAIIACGLAGQILARLILQTGTAQRMRYLDLTAIRAHPGSNVATSPIGMHSMSGCDSTSAISGWGKRAAFELLKTPHFQNTMSLLGISFHVSKQLHEECEALVCTLYGKPASWTLMNCATVSSAQGPAEQASFPAPMSRCPEVSHHACRLSSCYLEESPGSQARYSASQWPWMDTRYRRCVVHSLGGPASCTSSAVGAGFAWLHQWVCNKTMHMQDPWHALH